MLPSLKNVISENIVFDVQLKNFLFHGKIVLRSRDMRCLVSPTIPSTVKFVTP